MSLGSTLLGLVSVLLMALGQILFKMAGHTLQSPMQWQQWLSAPMIAAVVISSVATVLWIWVLRTTPLYIAYPLMALAFFFVPAGAYLMLNEPINNNTFIGAGLIIIGIVVSYL